MNDTSPCTVERKCSNTGIRCGVEDRACQDGAIARGLEIICESSEPRTYVYCPPGAEQRDSNVVWVLLVVALVIATMGSLVAFLGFRRTTPK